MVNEMISEVLDAGSNLVSIKIRTMGGEVHDVNAPLNFTCTELINELIAELELNTSSPTGKPIEYWLKSKNSGSSLLADLTLAGNGVQHGQTLNVGRSVLAGAEEEPQGLISVKIQTMGGEVHEIDTPTDILGSDFIAELVAALNLNESNAGGEPVVYRIDNKATGQALSPDKTLADNGVQDGNTLVLIREVVAGGIVANK